MRKQISMCLTVIGTTFVLFFAVLGTVWGSGSQPDVAIDSRLEQACHRAVKAKTVLDYRDIKTIGYNQKEKRLGILEGHMMTKYQDYGWANIDWSCHVHPVSGRVIRTEFRKGIRSKIELL